MGVKLGTVHTRDHLERDIEVLCNYHSAVTTLNPEPFEEGGGGRGSVQDLNLSARAARV